jgi:hypothetical protein
MKSFNIDTVCVPYIYYIEYNNISSIDDYVKEVISWL